MVDVWASIAWCSRLIGFKDGGRSILVILNQAAVPRGPITRWLVVQFRFRLFEVKTRAVCAVDETKTEIDYIIAAIDRDVKTRM